MRSQSVVLDVQNVTKKFGLVTAVNHVSLQVTEGEIYGLTGPNDSGKTTLVKMILGHLRPTSGNIVVSGYDNQKEYADAVDFIGATMEYPNHYPYLSGWQNLMLTANMYPEITKARVDEAAEQVGLKSVIHQKVKSYSLGMKQRLSIAQSILKYPQLLILDEPIKGFDPSAMHDFVQLIKSIAANGTSVLLTSYLLGEMEELCDRIGIMSHGYLIAEKATEDLQKGDDSSFILRVGEDSEERAFQVLRENQNKDVSETYAFDKTAECVFEIKDCTMSPSRLNRILVEAGVEVEEIRTHRQTLEELYTSLTGGAEIE
ncbi:MAG: ABC transporter ATP-binding protein [Firmicutes bacterium]|nr:ABC transporter ATP-binding protein [Bacillota bacterium]